MVEPQQDSGKTLEHYKLLKQLGDGNFGTAFLAEDMDEPGTHVALKVFKDLDEDTEKTFKAEVAAGGSGMEHPNVLNLLAAGRSQIMQHGQTTGDVFYIVSELASNGESFDYVEAAGGLDDQYARQVFGQLISGLLYVHNKNIAHRDLKLENCFLDKDVRVKIADFGLNKVFGGPSGEVLSTKCGTTNYMAPEINSQPSYQGPPVDVFACGAILFIMRMAKFAFGEANDVFYRRLQRDPVKAMAQRGIPIKDPNFLSLVHAMTHPDPAQRMQLDQVMSHPYMQGQTATADQVRDHYYAVVPECKAINQEHYETMQHARSSWAQSVGVERGHDDGEEDFMPNGDVIGEWSAINTYKEYNMTKAAMEVPGPYKTGFFSEAVGNHLFAKVWEIYKKYQVAKKIPTEQQPDPEYTTDDWKMTLNVQEPVCEKMEPMEGDSEEEEEASIPMVSATVTITVKSIGEVAEDEIPKKVYLNFKRVDGSQIVFRNFLKTAMVGLEMFVLP